MSQPQIDPVSKALNKLSVKFNAKNMLDQEVGEAISEYINITNQVIADLRKKVADLETEVKLHGKDNK